MLQNVEYVKIFLRECSLVFDLCMLSSLINKKRGVVCETATEKQDPSDVQGVRKTNCLTVELPC